MKSIFYKLSFCLSFLLFISCSDDDDDNNFVSPYKDASIIDTVSVETIKQLYTGILQAEGTQADQITAVLAKIKYDVVLAKVEYKAVDPFGVEKTLSGLVAYPVLKDAEKNKNLSVVSIQHGTLTLATQAPTSINKAKLVARDGLGLISASHENGYMSVQADYFGYGTDVNNLHYYEHAESLAESVRKLIESAPAYATKQSLTLSYDKLFLFGYSEGGGATISTLKSFSEKGSSFKDYVTVAGAGAYDKPATAKYIIQQTTGDSPQFSASYAWVGLTYNRVYKINRELDKLFDPLVVPEISKYVDNNNIMTTQALPAAPAEVFNANFTAGMLDGSDKEFIAAFEANNISDFQAKGSINLVYGTNDTWVPPFNTVTLAENLTKRGISSTVTAFEGGTHSSTYVVFAIVASTKLY